MKDFYEEQKVRNSVTRSARQRTGGKKKYLLPSDRLSPSELKKMNGEIAVYEMKKPISTAKFRGYPKEIQKEYLQYFVDEFGASAGSMGCVFGVSGNTAWSLINEVGLRDMMPKYPKHETKHRLEDWMKQFQPEEEIKEEPIPEEPKKEKVKVVEQPMFFNTITGCEMNFEGKASEISQTLFTLFRDQRIAVSVVFLGAKEESVTEDAKMD